MRITIFGATGKVGRQVAAEAVARGHSVVAFQRRPAPVLSSPNMQVCLGDIHEADKVADALRDSDAVISALGSWSTPTKDILSTGMRHIIPAMQLHGVRRIISLTGTDAQAPGDAYSGPHRLTHALLGVISPKVLSDSEEHIRLLDGSNLDWTVIRSPVMTPGSSMRYALVPTRPLPWQTINRSAVAAALLDQLDDRNHIGASPYLIRT